MKKILCAVIAVMIAAQCAVYAETDNHAADNDIALLALPTETIGNSLTADESDAITAVMKEALEGADTPESDYVEINIYDNNIDIDMFDDSGIEDPEHYSARTLAARGIVENYIADHPEYFYFKSIGVNYTTKTKKLYSIRVGYKYNAEEIKTIQDKIDAEVRDILKQMQNDGVAPYGITDGTDEEKQQSEFDRALWLHDYLADTIAYDNRVYSLLPSERDKVERSIDAALLDRLTVCRGYAEAYKYILEKIGMECVNVYSDDEEHEWSAVKIGCKWYYVDVTQDDNDALKTITHEYFLVTPEELLGGAGTHRNGYITEINLNDMTFGTDYENKAWHGNWKLTEGGNGNPVLEWNESIVNSRVVFNGTDRYYCSYTEIFEGQNLKDAYSAVHKCRADFSGAEMLCEIDGGLWYVNDEKKSFIPGYYGGLGKYTYANTSDDEKHSGKSYLYFNSPNAIYELNLDEPESQPEKVFEYEPEGSEHTNSMFGISAHDTVKYMTADILVDNGYVNYSNIKEFEEQIACNVRFYVTVDTLLLSGILTYPYGTSIDAPGPEMYGKIVKLTNLSDGSVWEYNKPITESVRLNWSIESAHWAMTPQLRSRDGLLIGSLNASIYDIDKAYCEAPDYMFAVYEDNALVAVRKSEDGKFTFTADDNIPYTQGTSEIRVYAWNSSLMPYLDSRAVTVQSAPSSSGGGGGGESEEGNEEDNGGDDIDTDTTDSE